MAELKLFDIAGAFNEGHARGTQMRKTNRLAELASQAYGAAPGQRDQFVQEAIASDPQSGFALSQSLRTDEEARNKTLVNMARMLTSAPEGQRASIYAGMVPQLQRMGLQQLPVQYDPTVDETARAIVQAYAGGREQEQFTLGPGSKRFDGVGNVVAEVPFAPANANIVKVPDGQGGTLEMVWDPRARQLEGLPVPGTAPSAPASWVEAGATYQTPQGVVRIGADLSPEDLEAVQADISSGGASDSYRLPSREATPGRAGSGGFGYTPPKREDAPAGYRFRPDGVTLEPIPGGPQDASSPAAAFKDEQSMRKEVSDQIKQDRSIIGMYSNVQNAARNPSAAGDLSMIFAFMKMLDPGSVVREQEFANAQNAAGIPDQVRNAYNRALQGQRLNPAQRADFLAQAAKLQEAAQGRITNTAQLYQGIAEQYGFDAERSTGMPDFRSVNAGAGGGPVRVQTADDYGRLPSGATYITPDGMIRRKP